MTHAFDALKAAEAMARAGVEESHAKAIAATVRDSRSGLATATDLRNEIAGIEARLKAEIGAVKWVLGMLTVLVLAIAGRLFGIV